ncbi:hypothetical protein H6776_01895 [Candidatus Nomurabacteria bacterium]|nr:hypothetical protein [Candidatus Nomurabacteria bacterium]
MYLSKYFSRIRFIVVIGIFLSIVFFSFRVQAANDRLIEINITAPSFVTYVDIASSSDFSGAVRLPASSTVYWDICRGATLCPSGTYPLFIRYVDNAGSVYYTTNRIVSYQAPLPPEPEPVIEPTPEPTPEPVPEPEPVIEPTPEPTPEPVPEPEPVIEPTPEPIIEPVTNSFKDWSQSDAGQATLDTVAGVSLVGSVATSIGSLFGNSFSLSQLIFLPLRIWNLLLIFFGIRRRSQPWGVVYDSKTKQPLDPVYVQLLDEDGNEVATSITDIQGRFGFLIEQPGKYRLNAGKTNYLFPSKYMQLAQADVLYDEVYHGELLSLARDGVITKNIPMDAKGTDWNQEEKQRMRIGGVSKTVATLSHIVFYAGLVFTLIMTIMSPTKINITFTCLYLGMQILRMIGFHPRAFGVIEQTDNPLVHGVVKIFNAALGHRVAHAVTDDKGRYYALVPDGQYYMTVEEKKDDETYERLYQSQPFHIKSGIINRSIRI